MWPVYLLGLLKTYSLLSALLVLKILHQLCVWYVCVGTPVYAWKGICALVCPCM